MTKRVLLLGQGLGKTDKFDQGFEIAILRQGFLLLHQNLL